MVRGNKGDNSEVRCYDIVKGLRRLKEGARAEL